MQNILKAKPLCSKNIQTASKYFGSKSAIFDTFDEVFLHIGMIVNKKAVKPSELIELAIEDIEFASQDELMEHVSLYFEFHNSIVRFVQLLETVKNEDELFASVNDVIDSLCSLYNDNAEHLQEKVVYEAKEILKIVFEDYKISGANFVDIMKQVDDAFLDKQLVDAVADVLKMLEFNEKKEATLENVTETMRYVIILAMVFSRLKKENKVSKIW